MNSLSDIIRGRLAVSKKIRLEIEKYPRRGRVVDIGCGNGYNTAVLAAVADEVVGMDTDRKKVEAARIKYPDINFRQMNAARTDYPDGYFDTAFLIMFLHEDCSDGVIGEVCRIAREVVVVDYSRVIHGITGKIIRMVEKEKFRRFADLNLAKKFSEFGLSLKESRSIHPNFYIYFFVPGKAAGKSE